jgi:hypothetical protein
MVMTTSMLVGAVMTAFFLGLLVGHGIGFKKAIRKVFRTLGVPPGYEIDSVSFRKAGKS